MSIPAKTQARASTTRWLWVWLALAFAVLSAPTQAGEVTYIYTDAQGTPMAEADADGNIIAQYDYMPYGAPVPSLGPAPNGPGYTGHVNDPDTGLVYMQARYYDPAVGRFLSVDPVGPSPGNTFNFNRYNYANNNPYKYVDPDGRFVDTAIDVGYAIYDSGVFLGDAISYGIGKATGNQYLTDAAREGLHESSVNVGLDVAAVIIPGVPAPALHAAETAGKAIKTGSHIAKDAAEGAAHMGGFKAASSAQLKGVDQHAFKESVMGKGASVKTHNISVDKSGNVVLTPVKKGGSIIETGYNVKDLPNEFGRKK